MYIQYFIGLGGEIELCTQNSEINIKTFELINIYIMLLRY